MIFRSDGNYSGECIMHFDTTSNFFVEIPIGNLNISKIEINGRDGAVIENDLVFEFYLKNKVEEAPSST